MSMPGLKDTLDGLARECGVRWYGYVLRKDEGGRLRRALHIGVAGTRKHGRLNMTRKRQVEEHIDQNGLKRKMPLTERSGVMVFINFHET